MREYRAWKTWGHAANKRGRHAHQGSLLAKSLGATGVVNGAGLLQHRLLQTENTQGGYPIDETHRRNKNELWGLSHDASESSCTEKDRVAQVLERFTWGGLQVAPQHGGADLRHFSPPT